MYGTEMLLLWNALSSTALSTSKMECPFACSISRCLRLPTHRSTKKALASLKYSRKRCCGAGTCVSACTTSPIATAIARPWTAAGLCHLLGMMQQSHKPVKYVAWCSRVRTAPNRGAENPCSQGPCQPPLPHAPAAQTPEHLAKMSDSRYLLLSGCFSQSLPSAQPQQALEEFLNATDSVQATRAGSPPTKQSTPILANRKPRGMAGHQSGLSRLTISANHRSVANATRWNRRLTALKRANPRHKQKDPRTEKKPSPHNKCLASHRAPTYFAHTFSSFACSPSQSHTCQKQKKYKARNSF